MVGEATIPAILGILGTRGGHQMDGLTVGLLGAGARGVGGARPDGPIGTAGTAGTAGILGVAGERNRDGPTGIGVTGEVPPARQLGNGEAPARSRRANGHTGRYRMKNLKAARSQKRPAGMRRRPSLRHKS